MPRPASLLAAALLFASALPALAQVGASLTYQGELHLDGAPASGTFDLRFSLFDAAGTQIGLTQCADNVPVANGKFTVILDFGDQFSARQPRELELAARADTGAPCSDPSNFATLSPRQPITSAPFASSSLTASNSLLLSGNPSSFFTDASNLATGTLNATRLPPVAARTDMLNTFSAGNTFLGVNNFSGSQTNLISPVSVGSPVSTPQAPLHLREGSSGSSAFTSNAAAIFERSNACFLQLLTPDLYESGILFGNTLGGSRGALIYNDTGLFDLRLRTDNATRLTIEADGDVGVGTSLPFAKLHVNGSFLTPNLSAFPTIDASAAPTALIFAGYSGNSIAPVAAGATISGGGRAGGSTAGDYLQTITDEYGFIGGGYGNRAGDDASDPINASCATVAGGRLNTASGLYASVLGGESNAALAESASVGGGDGNRAESERSAIGGGGGNRVFAENFQTGAYGFIGGGNVNRVTGRMGTVAGGQFNEVIGAHGTVGGGFSNSATILATVAGGGENSAAGAFATVGGGELNSAANSHAVVAGGKSNTADGSHSAVLGGSTNHASGDYAAIGGGFGATASGDNSVVAGGQSNAASAAQATVGGGGSNSASALNSTIAGGRQNAASDFYASVGGGWTNTATGESSTIAGGQTNAATGFGATVAGGQSNSATGGWSTIPGGHSNTAGGTYSLAAGRRAIVRTPALSGDSNGDEGSFVFADSIDANFVSTGPNQFLIRAGGGVGIGTADPLAPFHVRDGSSGTPSIGSSRAAVFERSSSAFINILTPTANESGLLFGNPLGSSEGAIIFNDAGTQDLRFRTQNSNRMTITSTGLVGINTSAPTSTLQVIGTISATVKNFRIDHPLDPANKDLVHSCIESDEYKNLYDGEVTTGPDGYATIDLPSWFEALNENFRYQLTIIDDADTGDPLLWARISHRLANNRFTIRTSQPGTTVCWQITGTRKDDYAKSHPLIVEQPKPKPTP